MILLVDPPILLLASGGVAKTSLDRTVAGLVIPAPPAWPRATRVSGHGDLEGLRCLHELRAMNEVDPESLKVATPQGQDGCR